MASFALLVTILIVNFQPAYTETLVVSKEAASSTGWLATESGRAARGQGQDSSFRRHAPGTDVSPGQDAARSELPGILFSAVESGRSARTTLELVAALTSESGTSTGNANPELPDDAARATVNKQLVSSPNTLSYSDDGQRSVAVSRDSQGVSSAFVEGLVLIRPADVEELQIFLHRYDGTIVYSDEIPEPPPELDIELSQEQRRPTEYTVSINLDRVDVTRYSDIARQVGLVGLLEFSSLGALQTFAAVLDARAAGYDAGANWLDRSEQFLPGSFGVLFETFERQTSATGATPVRNKDAFDISQYGTGWLRSNVTLAWQFVAAHGYQKRIRIAIVDGGFYLTPAGLPRGDDSDFAAPKPIQLDLTTEDGDLFADGINPNPIQCGPNKPCYWHGTGSASVAAGEMDNRRGEAGTGSLVAEPMLFKFDGTRSQRNRGIRAAIAWGADVVSMSFGGPCNQACRVADRSENLFDDHVAHGGRVVFVAAAGNGRQPLGSPPGTPGVGFEVGNPNFVHACIEDRVICVGALKKNAWSAESYSNFGSQVQIWAPTDIPVMAFPSSLNTATSPPTPLTPAQADGTPIARTFGGTSASAPFVAGVVALMKAINPDLNHDEVNAILIQTGQQGIAPVTRVIDAYAAVKRAAYGIDSIADRLEPNSVATNPTNLGSTPPYEIPTLSLDRRDRDYFRFVVPKKSEMTIRLEYPVGLGPISILGLRGLGGECGAVSQTHATSLPNGRGHQYTYVTPGGPLSLGLEADDVNAYHLRIRFTATAVPMDPFERNDQVRTATHLPARALAGGVGIRKRFVTDHRFRTDATIHRAIPADVDYYVIRGAQPTMSETVFLAAAPTVKVHGNESPVHLQVFTLNSDWSQGSPLAELIDEACVSEPLAVRLQANHYYLVRIAGRAAGTTGQYTLSNGVDGEWRRLPGLVRDRVYEVLNPLDPIIAQVITAPRYHVLMGDPAYSEVRVTNPAVRATLVDGDGSLVTEGIADKEGVILSLADTTPGELYALVLTIDDPQAAGIEYGIEWDRVEPTRNSGNLIRNPGAEMVGDDASGEIMHWDRTNDVEALKALRYADRADRPSPSDPGPSDRGLHLFGIGSDSHISALAQEIVVAPEWREAIEAKRVKFRLAAYLGGNGQDGDFATLSLRFLHANGSLLGQIDLPTITTLDRHGETGLWPVETIDMVPSGTTRFHLELSSRRISGISNDGYAEKLELILSEYPERPRSPIARQ